MKAFVYLLLAAAVTLTGCARPTANPAICSDPNASVTDLSNPYFAVAVQQGGRKIPIVDHAVSLARGPFDFLIALPEEGGVFVNASTESGLYRQAKSRGALDEQRPFEAMQEDADNILALDAPDWQYWYYLGPGISKFTDVRLPPAQATRKVWIGKKALGLWRFPGGDTGRMSDFRGGGLYLVFVRCDWNTDRTRRVEQAREYLRIVFR